MFRRRKTSKHGLLFVYIGILVLVFLIGGTKLYVIRSSALAKKNAKSSVLVDNSKPVVPLPQNSVTAKVPLVEKPDGAIPPIVNGLAPVITTIKTNMPVVFLGIDDGAYKKDFELKLMKANNIKASLFLANRFISNDPFFFVDFISAGSLIENHTMNHKLLSQLSYQEQKAEICDAADLFLKEFGRRPVLMRPPGGNYNVDTQRAAADCGMKAVVLWIAKANGGSMQYQVGHSLRPGDIVLMHFRPEFQADMQAFLDAEHAAGLHTVLLEDWIK